jgi:hypothetical protein
VVETGNCKKWKETEKNGHIHIERFKFKDFEIEKKFKLWVN